MADPLAQPRVRFAPSPTGFLHVGGARTALFNWLYARQTGGSFLLRIEDTDKARGTEESERAIFDGLEWLGLNWDEHVVHQALGLPRHQRDANFLLETGSAYRCFCTPPELEAMRQEAAARKDSFKYDRRCDRLAPDEIARRVEAGMSFVVRFRIAEGETEWNDAVHERIAFPNKDIEDFVILRSDGTPIYNLAVVSDDIDMAITLVMRGDDHISNTPKQILLYRALGTEPPRFAHVPMIHGMDGKKLSKRHGATAVADYQKEGILPGAMVNFLALMGWSPGGDREVMSLEEMITLFSLAGLQKKAAIFDTKKLEWMNGQHLSRVTAMELEPRLTPALIEGGVATAEMLESRREWYLGLIDLLKVRARTVLDMVRQAAPFFPGALAYDPEAIEKQWKDRDATAALLQDVQRSISGVAQWTPESLEEVLRALATERGVGAGKIFQPLRVALTGLTVSPGIFEVLIAMGPELTTRRLNEAHEFLKQAAV